VFGHFRRGTKGKCPNSRPVLKLKRRPIIKASLPTSPRLRRAGRDGMFSVCKHANMTSNAPAEFGDEPGSTSLGLRHLLRRRNFFVRSRNRRSGLCQSGSAGLTPLSTKRPLPCLRKLLQFAPRDNTQMVNGCATMGVVQEKRVGTQMQHRHCRG